MVLALLLLDRADDRGMVETTWTQPLIPTVKGPNFVFSSFIRLSFF